MHVERSDSKCVKHDEPPEHAPSAPARPEQRQPPPRRPLFIGPSSSPFRFPSTPPWTKTHPSTTAASSSSVISTESSGEVRVRRAPPRSFFFAEHFGDGSGRGCPTPPVHPAPPRPASSFPGQLDQGTGRRGPRPHVRPACSTKIFLSLSCATRSSRKNRPRRPETGAVARASSLARFVVAAPVTAPVELVASHAIPRS